MRNSCCSSRALVLISSTGFIIIICICITIIYYKEFTIDMNWGNSYIPPPYLLVNAIILLLIASSRCFPATAPPPPSPIRFQERARHQNYHYDDDMMMISNIGSTSSDDQTFTSPEEEEKQIVLSSPELRVVFSGSSRPKTSNPTSPPEKLTSRRRNKLQKHDTLENTWKTIMENRDVAVSSQLENSNTVENSAKSEMLRDCTNYEATPPPASSKLIRDVSLTKEEVNRRVEAFINKFNGDTRLQGQTNP